MKFGVAITATPKNYFLLFFSFTIKATRQEPMLLPSTIIRKYQKDFHDKESKR